MNLNPACGIGRSGRKPRMDMSRLQNCGRKREFALASRWLEPTHVGGCGVLQTAHINAHGLSRIQAGGMGSATVPVAVGHAIAPHTRRAESIHRSGSSGASGFGARARRTAAGAAALPKLSSAWVRLSRIQAGGMGSARAPHTRREESTHRSGSSGAPGFGARARRTAAGAAALPKLSSAWGRLRFTR